MHASTRRLTFAAAAAFALVVGGAASPAVAATPSPVAVAYYGQAEVSVRADQDGPGRYELVYRGSQSAIEVPVDVALPSGLTGRNQALGLGLDGTGRLTVVMQSPRGLLWTHVTDPSPLQQVPGTAGAEHPAIYKGRIGYVCQDGHAICRASLRTKARQVLYREPKSSPWILGDVRIGPKSAIAIGALRDGALGASRILVKQPGAKPKTLRSANLDGGDEVLLRDISPDGTHLSLINRNYGQDEPVDTLALFRFPSGKPAS